MKTLLAPLAVGLLLLGLSGCATIVKSKQGTRMGFDELTPGSKVFVFWVPDAKDENARFARSISVYVAAQDWKGARDAEVPAAPSKK